MTVRSAVVTILAGTLAIIAGGPRASAQTSYAGVWRTGPTRITVTVHSWGSDCGPQPTSTTQPGGGTVEITESGRNLAIHAADRTILSNACWSPNRALSRVSSSFLDGVWTTKCRTPPSDPKSEEGEYVLKVESQDTLQYRDSSNYNWQLRESRCVATIVTTQTLTRGSASAATPTKTTPAATTKVPVAEPEEPDVVPTKACTPGMATRLVMRPKHAQIEPGQRVCIKATAYDATGCVVPQVDVRWSLQHSPALRGSMSAGCFEAASSAAEAEGEFKIVAQAGGIRAEAVVNVTTVDFSDLIARRMETGAVAGHSDQAAADAQSQTAAKIQTRDTPPPATPVGLWLAVGTVIVLGGGFVAWRLRKPAPAAAANDGWPVARNSSFPPTAAPAAPTAPTAPPAASITTAAASPSELWICPTCRRGHPKEQVMCSCTPGGTALMPYAEFAKIGRPAPTQDHKVCSGCGKQCPATAGFCVSCGKRF